MNQRAAGVVRGGTATRRLARATAVAVLTVTTVAAGWGGSQAQLAAEPVSPEPVAAAPASASAAETTAAPAAAAPPEATAQPAAIAPRIPKHLRLWRFDADVVPVEPDGAELVPPSDPTVLGWWGRPAGSTEGTTLLVGHTVSTGGGTLDDLEHTPGGAIARVSGVRYRVESVEVISKAQLAKRAARLFDQAGKPRLVLVTCEGYDPETRRYADNVVVVATPVQ